MKHRHINTTDWPRAALFSLMERGSREDFLDFMDELKTRQDQEIIVQDFLYVSDNLGLTNFSRTMLKSFDIYFKAD